MRSEGPDRVGSRKPDGVSGSLPGAQGRGKIAVLGRTKLGLFEEMVKQVSAGEAGGGIGNRNWNSEWQFGIGIRIWNSELEFGIGIRKQKHKHEYKHKYKH